jgi:dihydrofolate reductase
MRKVIFSIPITIDGFIEGPHRELDWVIADDDLHEYYARLLNNAGVILYGRVTYELMASYWPTASNDTTIPISMLNFANALNPLPKIVFSNTLQHVGWNTTVLKAVVPEEINNMKSVPGGDIIVGGGAALAQTFIRNGLVDEIQLMVQPVAIGAGKALFQGIDGGMKFNYIRSQTFQSGAVVLCYQPDGKVYYSIRKT